MILWLCLLCGHRLNKKKTWSQDSSKPRNFHHLLHFKPFCRFNHFQLNQTIIFVPFLPFPARNPPMHDIFTWQNTLDQRLIWRLMLLRERNFGTFRSVANPLHGHPCKRLGPKCNVAPQVAQARNMSIGEHRHRVLKCDFIKMKFLKLWDLSGHFERTMSKRPSCQKWAFGGKLSLRS